MLCMRCKYLTLVSEQVGGLGQAYPWLVVHRANRKSSFVDAPWGRRGPVGLCQLSGVRITLSQGKRWSLMFLGISWCKHVLLAAC